MEEREQKPLLIRWAREEEWSPAMQMIWRTFLKYDGVDYTAEGIRNFFDFITDDDLYVAFLKGSYRLMVALDGEEVIGAGTLRGRNQLSLLFVDEKYHHQGIGREILDRLCAYLVKEAGERSIFVKAAPYAVGFYQRTGFLTVVPEKEYSGIRVTEMIKNL